MSQAGSDRTNADRAEVNRTNRGRIGRLARATGVLAPTASLAGIAFAIRFTPSFAWAGSALSDLGAPSASTPWLFNGGLVLGGLFALPFAWWRWRQGANPIERVGAIGLAGTGLALSGVGLFPTGTALHLALAGRVPRGLVWIWVGVVHFSGGSCGRFRGSAASRCPRRSERRCFPPGLSPRRSRGADRRSLRSDRAPLQPRCGHVDSAARIGRSLATAFAW